MKKLSCVLLVLVLMFSLFACGGDKTETTGVSTETTTQRESVTEYSESLTEIVTETISENTVYESLSERLIREIDGEYKEKQELPENCTTIGMVKLADEYCEKWEQVADEYYNKLMEYEGIIQFSDAHYTSEDLHTFVFDLKSNWEQYRDEDYESYMKILQTISGGGTAVGPLFADYRYNMEMEWALKLIEICQHLRIE